MLNRHSNIHDKIIDGTYAESEIIVITACALPKCVIIINVFRVIVSVSSDSGGKTGFHLSRTHTHIYMYTMQTNENESKKRWHGVTYFPKLSSV